MNNEIVFWGVNGRLGKALAAELSKDYYIVGVDVQERAQTDCAEYIQFHSLSQIDTIYSSRDTYAVLHCQQVKPEGFVKSNLLNLELEEFDRIIDINLRLSFLSSQAYVRNRQSVEGNVKGRIVNFVSTYSILSSNPSLYINTEMGNPLHYTVSKAGLYGMTKYIAANFADYGVLCNSVAPHGVENGQSADFQENFGLRSPAGRLSEPQEVLPAVEFLLDERSTYVNGANIAVDGGWTAC
jgi:NAD(P)-dependent dehydrogenase (short-subunit alcohol dehydrogenase family)